MEAEYATRTFLVAWFLYRSLGLRYGGRDYNFAHAPCTTLGRNRLIYFVWTYTLANEQQGKAWCNVSSVHVRIACYQGRIASATSRTLCMQICTPYLS